MDFFYETPSVFPYIHLLFLEYAYALKAFDRCIGGFHGFEAKRWFYKLFKLAIIDLNGSVAKNLYLSLVRVSGYREK